MLKATELRDQTNEELEATLVDKRKQLFEMINESQQTKKIEKTHLLRQLKRGIARILTILNEKQRA